MIEIILNRLRGTGDIFKIFSFAITGTIIYTCYLSLLITGLVYFLELPLLFIDIGILLNGKLYIFTNTIYSNAIIVALLTAILFLVGESMGWGKWTGYLTADKSPENYDDLEGYDFPYIHKTANLIVKERKNYKLYCQVALVTRGLYWWTPLYLFFAFIGLISYIEAIIIGILLGIAFPLACEIGKRLDYNGKFWIVNYSKGWENQELVYGLSQGLFFNYVIITNIIN